MGGCHSLAEPGTRYLKSSAAAAIWQKTQRRCRLSPLVAAAILKKKIVKKNNGIQMQYLMVKFLLYLQKLLIQAFKISVRVTNGISRPKW